MDPHGRIVILNGVPRSGKSSIAAEIRRRHPQWLSDGVDADMAMTPAHHLPGIGLRPGGERPELEPVVQERFAALYRRVCRRSDAGRSVVLDVGHHDWYATPLGTLGSAAELLQNRRAWLIGVRCPIETIMQRRDCEPTSSHLSTQADGSIPEPVRRWQIAVHDPGVYDLEVDTSRLAAPACAERILHHIDGNDPIALKRIGQGLRP